TLDLVGIDVALDVFTRGPSLVADDGGGRRVLDLLRADGHLGRKGKRGIFLYGDAGRGTNPHLAALLAKSEYGQRGGAREDVGERVWLRLINEYLCCVAEGLGERDERSGERRVGKEGRSR